MKKRSKPTVKSEIQSKYAMNQAKSKVLSMINSKLDDYLLKGLNKKGYEFENLDDLKTFIQEHCSMTDDVQIKQRIFYVKKVPFFLHNYEPIIKIEEKKKWFTASASIGTYAYL